MHEEINTEQGVREAMLAVRWRPAGSTQIQLMAPLDENCTIAKFIGKRGPGIQQLACRVSDLDASPNNCATAACDCSMTHPRHGTANSRINFIHPKTPAASWWNSSSRPSAEPTGSAERLGPSAVGPRLARLRQHGYASAADPPSVSSTRHRHMAQCRNGFRDRIPGSGGSERPGARNRNDLVVVTVRAPARSGEASEQPELVAVHPAH